jgi:hypothetical protein
MGLLAEVAAQGDDDDVDHPAEHHEHGDYIEHSQSPEECEVGKAPPALHGSGWVEPQLDFRVGLLGRQQRSAERGDEQVAELLAG